VGPRLNSKGSTTDGIVNLVTAHPFPKVVVKEVADNIVFKKDGI
jgi:hypothetical protein